MYINAFSSYTYPNFLFYSGERNRRKTCCFHWNIRKQSRSHGYIYNIYMHTYVYMHTYKDINIVVVKMQNICDLIGWSSVHISNIFIFICCSVNITVVWNSRKLGGIKKYLKLCSSKPYMYRYRINQLLKVLNLYSIFIQWNSTHGIYYSESFTEFIFDLKHVNTVKWATF